MQLAQAHLPALAVTAGAAQAGGEAASVAGCARAQAAGAAYPTTAVAVGTQGAAGITDFALSFAVGAGNPALHPHVHRSAQGRDGELQFQGLMQVGAPGCGLCWGLRRWGVVGRRPGGCFLCDRPGLGVEQFEGCLDLLETCLGLRGRIAIRVPAHGQTPVGALDVMGAGSRSEFQCSVGGSGGHSGILGESLGKLGALMGV